MRPSSASSRALLLALLPLIAVAARGEDGPGAGAGPAVDHPPAPDEATPAGGTLVLPTRIAPGSSIDGPTVDVLLASALQESGQEVISPDQVVAGFHEQLSLLSTARESYLDMELEVALEQAMAARASHLDHHGELLGCGPLTEAELFAVQVLLDLGRSDEALVLAQQILMREPGRRLDPAAYSPAMQGLWADAVRLRQGVAPDEPDPGELATLAREVGVGLVVTACWIGSGEDGEQLAIHVVPSDPAEPASRHEVSFGAPSFWATAVRAALWERFPPPVAPRQGPPPEEVDAGPPVEDRAIYERWWFWTVVGVVVVGGTAGGIGGYYATREQEKTSVTVDMGW